MTAPASGHPQPGFVTGAEASTTPTDSGFITHREMVGIALTVATMLLLFYDLWTSSLRGAKVSGDMYVFVPHILLLVAIIGDLRKLAAIASGLLLVIGGLFVLLAILMAMVGSTGGSSDNTGTMVMAIGMQVPLFIACLRHARANGPSLPQPVLRARIALGLAAGAATWLMLSTWLAHQHGAL